MFTLALTHACNTHLVALGEVHSPLADATPWAGVKGARHEDEGGVVDLLGLGVLEGTLFLRGECCERFNGNVTSDA